MKGFKNILYNNTEKAIELINPDKLKKWTYTRVSTSKLKLLDEDIVKKTLKLVRKKYKIKSTLANNKRILLELLRVSKNIISNNFFKFYLYDTIFINNPFSLAITLLRVWGIESFSEDKFVIYEREVKDNWKLSESRLKEILLDKEILTVLINFIRSNNSIEAVPLIAGNINSEKDFLIEINKLNVPLKVKNLINRVKRLNISMDENGICTLD